MRWSTHRHGDDGKFACYMWEGYTTAGRCEKKAGPRVDSRQDNVFIFSFEEQRIALRAQRWLTVSRAKLPETLISDDV